MPGNITHDVLATRSGMPENKENVLSHRRRIPKLKAQLIQGFNMTPFLSALFQFASLMVLIRYGSFKHHMITYYPIAGLGNYSRSFSSKLSYLFAQDCIPCPKPMAVNRPVIYCD